MSRRWVWMVAVLAVLAIACKAPAGGSGGSGGEPPPTPVKGYPSSMVALGDSITAGYGSCFAPTVCPRNSWSTGDGTRVSSHYRKIVKANPAMSGHARNLAASGATVDDLRGQATAAVKTKAAYVTVLIGANDACRAEMTSVGTFRDRLDDALGTLRSGLPKARLLLVSIPDVYRVWEVGRKNSVAVKIWNRGICPSLLKNATSTAAADVARRQAFQDRVADFNRELRDACADYGSRCRYDDISRFSFNSKMLSALDFFHPNSAGQQALAEETFPRSFTW